MSRELRRTPTDDGDVVQVVDGDLVLAEVRQRGAQVTRWRPDGGDDVVFAGSQHQVASDRVAHGGVPVCFPWFANGPRGDRRPTHGPARSVPWTERGSRLEDGALVSRWSLDAAGVRDADGGAGWPAGLRAELSAELGQDAITISLTASNDGDEPVTVEVALHSYLRVGDVGRVRLVGLDGAEFLDKVASAAQGVPVRAVQEGDVVVDGEVDRVYSSHEVVEVHDPVLDRVVRVAKEGSGTTVVWNPWQEKGSALVDLAEGEWREYVCVETAAAGDRAIELEPGASHTVVQRVSVR